jgi:alkylation response protein AidB-like acyl-CoA dehydrogenase
MALTAQLADSAYATRDDSRLREVLQVRIAGSELALKAANAAMLHLGAKGYLLRNPAQRRLREAYFVAIVTPAIKHLKKELHDMAHPVCCAA